MRFLSIIIWFIGAFPFLLSAQNLHVTHYSIANGLPSDKVRHVIQDTFDFLWIATDNGLVRFDGNQFTTLDQEVPSQYGRYFFPTQNGIFYSHDAGLSLIQPALDSSSVELYKSTSIDPQSDLLYYPDNLFQQKNGALWVSQPNGKVIRFLNGQKKEFTVSDSGDKVSSFFAQTESGAFWIATQAGTLFYHDDTEDTLKEKASFPKINDLMVVEEEIWLAGGRIYQLTLSADGKKLQKTARYSSDLGEITALTLDSKKNLYLGIADQGLFFLDRRLGKASKFVKIFGNNDPHRVDELPFQNVNKIVLGSDGQLFVCTDEGLSILQRRFFESVGDLPNANTSAIAMSDQGKLFVNFGDLYAVSATEYGYSAKQIPVWNQGATTTLTVAREKLMVGTSTGMVLSLTQEGNLLQKIDLTERGEGIFNLHPDSKGRLWVCQAPEERPILGVGCLLPNGQLKEYGPEQGLTNRILALKETPQGRLYAAGIGLESYLYRYLPEEDIFVNLSLPLDFYVNPNFEVHDLTVDGEGIVWLASTNGLLRYDLDRISRVDLGPTYTNIEIRAVEWLPDGSIWISTDTEGLIHYKDEEFSVIKEESGLPTKVLTYRSLVVDENARLWVGTAEGVVYSLDQTPTPKKTNKPWLIRAIVGDQKLLSGPIRLFVDEALTVDVLTPAYHGYRMFYQYQLNETDWSASSIDHILTLQNLPPGQHKLAFRSKKEGCSLWSDPLFIEFEVIQYWYQNRYIQILIGCIFLLGLLGSFYSLRERLRRRIFNLSKKLKEEKEETEKKEKDLIEARIKIKMEQREMRSNLQELEILYHLIQQISPGQKMDAVIEELSIELLQIPGTNAFQLATKEGKNLNFEGFAKSSKGLVFYQIPYNPKANLAAYCIAKRRPLNFGNLSREMPRLLKDYDGRQDGYQSVICVPLRFEKQDAVLLLYSKAKKHFDPYDLKVLETLAAYLEQIT